MNSNIYITSQKWFLWTIYVEQIEQSKNQEETTEKLGPSEKDVEVNALMKDQDSKKAGCSIFKVVNSDSFVWPSFFSLMFAHLLMHIIYEEIHDKP